MGQRRSEGFWEVPRSRSGSGDFCVASGCQRRKADTAKPLKGFGSGVFEIALRYRSDTFWAVYAVQLDDDVWVLHALQKKSKAGIRTPKRETDLIRTRLKRVREQLQ